MEKLSLKKKRVMMYFIEATQKVIMNDGIENVSIKKIADEAGYNTATIYNYFENLEILILYASIDYLKDYLKDLKKEIKSNMKAIDIYEIVYKNFVRHSFEKPQIFHTLFFGRYSHKLSNIIKRYYEIFPDELEGHIDLTKSMILESDIHSRDIPIINQMIKEGSIDKNQALYIMQIIVRVHQSCLEDILIKESVCIEDYSKKFFDIFYFLLKK